MCLCIEKKQTKFLWCLTRVCFVIILQMHYEILLADVDQQIANQSSSSEPDNARIYRSPEERREAGLGTELANWLKFSGLLEIEKEYFEDNLKNNKKNREYGNTTPTLQLGFELPFTEWFGAELVYEAEHDGNEQNTGWDEAFIYFDFDDIGVGVEIGRISVPFGEYYSHFVTGPLLEFGETIRNGLVIEYSLFNFLEVSAFAIDSDIEEEDKKTEYDWGAGIEYVSATESVRVGLGYLSDLAESDERFLRGEHDQYIQRVSAWNAYALVGFEKFEITAEIVRAENQFREFNSQEDKPIAYNAEFAYFLTSSMQIALRYEGSDEFSDQPTEQYGIATTWRLVERISITTEYLHGRYKNNFVFNDDDELDDRDLFAMQFSIEF